MWGLIGAMLGAPAAAYLLTPPARKGRKDSNWVEAGSLNELTPGVPEQIVFRRNRADGWKITSEKAAAWVIRKADNEVVAFAPQCTHLGCGYRWEEEKQYFLCPCHSSAFSIDGRVLSGPAPRPLDRYEVKIEGGKVLLGPVRQSSGEPA